MAKNPVTIDVLETLDAIERRGSFAKAAEELNKATSAVSYAVQKLEEQLDIALFQRQGRRSVLTPAGQVILAEGRDILQATSRLANKAKEVANGWEPRIRIAIESNQSYSVFFTVLHEFLLAHPTIEMDVRECVLNGGWEALERGVVDLIIGSPGPVPAQKGYRAIPLLGVDLVPVIAASHAMADKVSSSERLEPVLSQLRRVITHDTSTVDITRSAGLNDDGNVFYVQNIYQKVAAIRAGIGIGHLPRECIQEFLNNGELIPLLLSPQPNVENVMAWKLSHKGNGLQALIKKLTAAFG